MRASRVTPTGVERTFANDEIIVSKTDLRGFLTYTNDVFLRMSAYTEDEVIGRPHNVIRHPDMPRSVFKLLWDTLQDGRELFAYVVNLASDGAHYWVLAHVTPTRNASGEIIGYHSNRRTCDKAALEIIKKLYAEIVAEERRHPHPPDALAAGTRLLQEKLDAAGMTYEEFVWSLEGVAA